jgi:hypothetical protein
MIGGLAWFLPRSGRLLVVDRPEKSDIIIVLAGSNSGVRYEYALGLLRAGYGRELLLDASADLSIYGRTHAQLAEQFAGAEAGPLAPHVHVCPIYGDSTALESKSVANCLAKFPARDALLVTSDFHTRRALSIFSHWLPQFRWSVAAAPDPYFFGSSWWQKREWAKTNLLEWQRLLWWELVERWTR